MGNKLLTFDNNINENGQYNVIMELSAIMTRKQLEELNQSFEKMKEQDQDFKEMCEKGLCTFDGKTLSYKSETLLPEKYDTTKPRVLLVLGNPATHSIKNRMFFFSKNDGKKRHSFWGKLDNAGLLKKVEKDSRKEEADERRNVIMGGSEGMDYVIGLTTFYSFPTPVEGDYKDVAGVRKLFSSLIPKIEEEEYERIKGYPFSKDAILVFTQKSSYMFVENLSPTEEKKRLLYWPLRGKEESSGDHLRGELEKIISKKH